MKPTYEELQEQLENAKREFLSADTTMQNLEAQLKQSKIDADCYKKGMEASNARLVQLAAENAIRQEFIKTCFRAAADGASLDGADIQEIGERLGLLGRETYQPALHGYICGHEAGEDSVYVMKPSPATDAFLAEVRAQAQSEVIEWLDAEIAAIDTMYRGDPSYEHDAYWMKSEVLDAVELARKAFAAQLRKGGAE